MNKVDELQKALEQFRDFVGTTPIQDEREIILKGKILVEFQKVEELFSCFRTKETVKEQSLRKLLEILEGKAKTLPQVVETCDFIRDRECKKCFGQCEFEGTEHFKGKWVSVEDVTALLMNLLHEKVLAEEKNVEYAKLVAGQAEEYAEKNADFQLLYKYVLVNFGQRCTIYEPRCPCCKAWKCFDYLTAHEKELLAGSRSLPLCEKCKATMRVISTRDDGCRYFECPKCGGTVGEETEDWFKDQEKVGV